MAKLEADRAAGRLLKAVARGVVSAAFALMMTGLFAVVSLMASGYLGGDNVFRPRSIFDAFTFLALPAVFIGALAFQCWQLILAPREAIKPLPELLRRSFLALTGLGLIVACGNLAFEEASAWSPPLLWTIYAVLALTAVVSDRGREGAATEDGEAAEELVFEAKRGGERARSPRRQRVVRGGGS